MEAMSEQERYEAKVIPRDLPPHIAKWIAIQALIDQIDKALERKNGDE